MSIYRNLPRYEFGAMQGGGCDVSFFLAVGNMGIMKRQLDHVLFCIAYKVMHQPFFGLKYYIKEESSGPRQANLVLIVYASSEGSGEPAHPRSLARTSAARSYKQ